MDRRQMMTGMAGMAGLAAGTMAATGPVAQAQAQTPSLLAGSVMDATRLGVETNSSRNIAPALQKALNITAKSGHILHLPAGIYRIANLTLPAGAQLSGVPGRTILRFAGGRSFVTLNGADRVTLQGLSFDGAALKQRSSQEPALLLAQNVKRLEIDRCQFFNTPHSGIVLSKCGGQITNCEIFDCFETALFSEDASGLDIRHNQITNIGNNGIQVWRSTPGPDHTIVAYNRIANIRAENGGTGQNGNAINMFRADNVQVLGNHIEGCKFSAIRGNAASNCQISSNACFKLGEVALYVEFASIGAIVTGNLIDEAGTGISITNFNKGGRLAVVQGNLIRNLFEKDGVGIGVEADSNVTGNVIETAANLGIGIGWGPYSRQVTVTSNLVRDAKIGIGISADPKAGYVFAANNFIAGAKQGGVRAMDYNKPIGNDLAQSGAEAFRNFALYGNVSI